jgi:hypothetical protein
MSSVLDLIVALFKAAIRNRTNFFWTFIFPILLLLVFGVLFTGHSESIVVYVANSSASKWIEDVLTNLNVTVKVIEGVKDPVAFLKTLAAMGESATYIEVTNNTIKIYSTSTFGPMIEGALYGGLYAYALYAYVGRVQLPYNISFISLTSANLFKMTGELISLRLALTLGLWTIAEVMVAIYALSVTGTMKMLYLSPHNKYKILLSVVLATWLIDVLSTFALAAVSQIFGMSAYYIFNPAFWLAYIFNSLFASGLGLLISAAYVVWGSRELPPTAAIPIFHFSPSSAGITHRRS